MGKVYTSSKQASDFIAEYKWWIVGILSFNYNWGVDLLCLE